MIKHGTYRDGGTRYFKNLPFHKYFQFDKEVCQDNRIGSETKGEWYLGYPNKDDSRLLTEEEKQFVVSEIIKHLGDEYRRSKYLYEDIRERNSQYLFGDNFKQVFSLRCSSGSNGHYISEYKSEDGFIIIDEDNRAVLKDSEGVEKGSGTLYECFAQYNILKGNI